LRSEPAQLTVAISATIVREEIASGWTDAFAEIYATLRAHGTEPAGPGGGLYATELFADDRGDATIFVPVPAAPPNAGRVHPFVVPAAELAVVTHEGSDENIDLAYGALGRYVSERTLGVDGPVREYYTVAAIDTPDVTRWRTEIAWPIFRTATP
jgi:effector-binding domain-containing protein